MGNLIERASKVDALQKENAFLKQELSRCRAAEVPDKSIAIQPTQRSTPIDPRAVDDYVDKLMETSNIAYLPDYVERKLYVNMFTVLLRMVDDVLEKSSIQLLGHEIRFDIAAPGGEEFSHKEDQK